MDNRIGKLIREKREEKKWTQLELANKMHRTPQAISSWESGRTVPNVNVLIEMADILGCDRYTFLTGEMVRFAKFMEESAPDNVEYSMPSPDTLKVSFPQEEFKLDPLRFCNASTPEPTTDKTEIENILNYAIKLNRLPKEKQDIIFGMIDSWGI